MTLELTKAILKDVADRRRVVSAVVQHDAVAAIDDKGGEL
jgi:hypothetical protein